MNVCMTRTVCARHAMRVCEANSRMRVPRMANSVIHLPASRLVYVESLAD